MASMKYPPISMARFLEKLRTSVIFAVHSFVEICDDVGVKVIEA
jgi:hypothetical protein